MKEPHTREENFKSNIEIMTNMKTMKPCQEMYDQIYKLTVKAGAKKAVQKAIKVYNEQLKTEHGIEVPSSAIFLVPLETTVEEINNYVCTTIERFENKFEDKMAVYKRKFHKEPSKKPKVEYSQLSPFFKDYWAPKAIKREPEALTSLEDFYISYLEALKAQEIVFVTKKEFAAHLRCFLDQPEYKKSIKFVNMSKVFIRGVSVDKEVLWQKKEENLGMQYTGG